MAIGECDAIMTLIRSDL